MDLTTAKNIIDGPQVNKPSEVAKAVDTLYQELGTYRAITQEIGRSDKFWIMRHRIYELPDGIRWKIDEGQIGIEQGYQISRLKQEEDQWLLAIVIIEIKGLTAKECEKVVSLVLNEGKSIRESLGILAGVHFDKIQQILLPLGSDIWILICKIAWAQSKKWEDLCYQLVLQGVSVDLQKIASQLESIAWDLRRNGPKKYSH